MFILTARQPFLTLCTYSCLLWCLLYTLIYYFHLAQATDEGILPSAIYLFLNKRFIMYPTIPYTSLHICVCVNCKLNNICKMYNICLYNLRTYIVYFSWRILVCTHGILIKHVIIQYNTFETDSKCINRHMYMYVQAARWQYTTFPR